MMHLGVHHYGQCYTWSLWLIWPYSVSHFVENNITLLLRYPAAENQDKGNDFILQGEKLRRDINHNFLAMRVDKCRHELKGEILKHHFQLSYPFICWWTSRLLPCPGYCSHWGARVSFNSGFLGVYAQQWDCWVIWQFYFQFLRNLHTVLHSQPWY